MVSVECIAAFTQELNLSLREAAAELASGRVGVTSTPWGEGPQSAYFRGQDRS